MRFLNTLCCSRPPGASASRGIGLDNLHIRALVILTAVFVLVPILIVGHSIMD